MAQTTRAAELVKQLRMEENLRVAAQCDDGVGLTISTHERCEQDEDYRMQTTLKGTCENAVDDLKDAAAAAKNERNLQAPPRMRAPPLTYLSRCSLAD